MIDVNFNSSYFTPKIIILLQQNAKSLKLDTLLTDESKPTLLNSKQ